MISLLVTDLDNALYDWVTAFVPAFYAMVRTASDILGVDQEQLLDDLKAVHQRYHNSEQPFALLETQAVLTRFPGLSPLERKNHLETAFFEFNDIRRQNLQLYPGVRDTLQAIRKAGCLVIGHTEAVVENSLHRLEILNLVDEMDGLYAPATRSQGHPDQAYTPIHERYPDFVHLLSPYHHKPDPTVLKEICEHHSIPVDHTLYVGDSMTRDISMAKAAGTYAAWARYGSNHDPDLWQKLVRVTHWTADDVAKEKRLREEFQDIHPDVEIDNFSELLSYFSFGPPVAAYAS